MAPKIGPSLKELMKSRNKAPSHKEYPSLPNHYNKYHSGRLLSEKEQLPLLPLNKKLIDSSLKKKKLPLYRRLKRGQMSIRACKLLPKW